MGRTVGELMDTMDAVEWQEWVDAYSRDPWTDDRFDMHAAQICATIAQVNGADVDVADFMPKRGPKADEVELSDDQLKYRAVKANALMGGSYTK